MAKILVVEDDAEARRPLARLLDMEGYQVCCAANAIEAMAAVKRERPDLILLDVMIPPMDGLTFLSLLRDDREWCQMPVILLTGLSDPQTIARAADLGVKEYLVKTQFTTDQLLESIRKHTQPAASR